MTTRSQWSGRVLIGLVMLFVLVAGLLKLTDLGGFEASVRTWELLPRSAVMPIVYLVPASELGLAGVWLLGLARWVPVWACAVMILVYSAAFCAHLAVSEPPDCGCLGRLIQFQSHEAVAGAFLLRNSALLMLLVVGGLLSRRRRVPSSGGAGATPRRAGAAPVRSGFTLIETVMVIGLVGLLISLLLPALGSARERAYRTDGLSDLRSHMQVLTAYSLDYDDRWPFLTDPEATYTIFRHPRRGAGYVRYFWGSNFWHWPLLGSYLPEDGTDMFVFSGDPSREWGIVSSYAYCSTMYSRPDFWNARTRTGPEQWLPVRVSETLFPSQKAGLWNDNRLDEGVSYLQQRVQFAACDGAVRTERIGSLTKPYPKGEGTWWGSFQGFGIPLMHTIDGVRGRDIE